MFRVTKPGMNGNRVTPFGRAMYALNIDTFDRPVATGVHKAVATWVDISRFAVSEYRFAKSLVRQP